MGRVQDHPKSCSTRSTQNSDFYTIGRISFFFFFHKHLSQIEDTEKTGTDKAMMVGKKPNELLTPLKRHSLITIVTGVRGTAQRRSISGSRFRSQAGRVEGAGRGLWSGAPGPAASRMLLFGSWRPGPFTICPSLGCGARRTQLWRRCDTHSFNCTYTKKGEQWDCCC